VVANLPTTPIKCARHYGQTGLSALPCKYGTSHTDIQFSLNHSSVCFAFFIG